MSRRLLKPSEALQSDFDVAIFLTSNHQTDQKDTQRAHVANGFKAGDLGFLLDDGFHEIIDAPKTCVLPNSPNWLLGLANVRGEIVSLIDLTLLLGIQSNEGDKHKSRYIVVDAQPDKYAIKVSDVTGRRTYYANQRLSSPPLAPLLQSATRNVFFQEGVMWIDADLSAVLKQAAA